MATEASASAGAPGAVSANKAELIAIADEAERDAGLADHVQRGPAPFRSRRRCGTSSGTRSRGEGSRTSSGSASKVRRTGEMTPRSARSRSAGTSSAATRSGGGASPTRARSARRARGRPPKGRGSPRPSGDRRARGADGARAGPGENVLIAPAGDDLRGWNQGQTCCQRAVPGQPNRSIACNVYESPAKGRTFASGPIDIGAAHRGAGLRLYIRTFPDRSGPR